MSDHIRWFFIWSMILLGWDSNSNQYKIFSGAVCSFNYYKQKTKCKINESKCKWNLRGKVGYNLPWVQKLFMCEKLWYLGRKLIFHIHSENDVFLHVVMFSSNSLHPVPDCSAAVDHHWQNWFPYLVSILWIVLHSTLTLVWILQYCNWSLLLYAPKLSVGRWLKYFINLSFGHLFTGSKYVCECVHGMHKIVKSFICLW